MFPLSLFKLLEYSVLRQTKRKKLYGHNAWTNDWHQTSSHTISIKYTVQQNESL